jgi:uncharacterized protein YbbK (DUF523 family)
MEGDIPRVQEFTCPTCGMKVVYDCPTNAAAWVLSTYPKDSNGLKKNTAQGAILERRTPSAGVEFFNGSLSSRERGCHAGGRQPLSLAVFRP